MEFKFIDLEEVTEGELLEILNYNTRCASFTKKEIEKLKQATTPSDGKINVVLQKEEVKEELNIATNNDFEEEVDYYLSDFRALSDDEIEEKISEVIPSRKNDHYREIMMRMSAEILRDIKEIDEIIISEKDEMNEEELNDYESEKALAKKKFELLSKRIKKSEVNKELEEDEEGQDNTLLFVTTASGNPRVLNDLKDIPQSYYDGFLELFKSIKDGSFKNVKRFIELDALRGTCEVKDFKIRVAFVRLRKDRYAIISAFMKKSDNDLGYREPLKHKVKDFKNRVKDRMKELMDDPDYLEENKFIEAEVFRILGDENTKEVQKVKRGDEV